MLFLTSDFGLKPYSKKSVKSTQSVVKIFHTTREVAKEELKPRMDKDRIDRYA
jgi:hypothetical protein